MEQDALISSLGDHLTTLSTLISTAVGLALVSGWTGLQRSKTVQLLSMEVSRSDAFFLLASVFIAVNIAATLIFLRIGDILLIVNDKNTLKALTVLGIHPWPFNPYAYFGPSLPSILYSSLGYACLIVIWWIGYSSLALFSDLKGGRAAVVTYIVFLGVGLASMYAIANVYGIILFNKMAALPPALQAGIRLTEAPRVVATFLGIGVGAGLFWLLQKFAAKRRMSIPSLT